MIFSDEEILAAIVFGLIKLVGYVYVVRRVARAYQPQKQAPALVVAIARIALGAVFALGATALFDVGKSWPWYGVLVLLRFVEWAMVFVLFYERTLKAIDAGRLSRHALFATAISCLLDLPAGFTAFVIPIMAYGIC